MCFESQSGDQKSQTSDISLWRVLPTLNSIIWLQISKIMQTFILFKRTFKDDL